MISTHVSKSIELPVVSLERADLGARFIVRDNFHNWKLSVSSERPVLDDSFQYLFHATPPVDPADDPLDSVYFEGFPSVLVFGYHAQNPRRWSAEIHGNYALWAVLFGCMRGLGDRRPLTWT